MSKTTENTASWLDSLEFGFRDYTRIDAEIKRARQDFEDFVQLKEKEKAEIEARFGFMRQILVGTDDESVPEQERLSTSVRAALDFIGFSVSEVDERVRSAIKKNACWVRDDGYSAIAEVVETEHKSPTMSAYAGLLGRMVTLFQRRDLVADSEGMCGLLIVNHDRLSSPFDRPKLYETTKENIVDAARDQKIGLLSTVELYKLAVAVKDSVLSKADAMDIIKEPGRIELPST
jgi:hypothetical protein